MRGLELHLAWQTQRYFIKASATQTGAVLKLKKQGRVIWVQRLRPNPSWSKQPRVSPQPASRFTWAHRNTHTFWSIQANESSYWYLDDIITLGWGFLDIDFKLHIRFILQAGSAVFFLTRPGPYRLSAGPSEGMCMDFSLQEACFLWWGSHANKCSITYVIREWQQN